MQLSILMPSSLAALRKFELDTGQACSASRYVTSDVVQGSCLGPFLFLSYINDVINLIREVVITQLYADDVKLYTVVHSDVDVLRLQNCFDSRISWCQRQQGGISVKKCTILCTEKSSKLPVRVNVHQHVHPHM